MERHLDDELEKFNKNLLEMAALTELSISECIKSLQSRDRDLAEKVIKADKKIDEFENIIDEQAIELHALFQPMAVDLRFISTGVQIGTELERIADLAVNIAKRVKESHIQIPITVIDEIPKLADKSKQMVSESINSFVKQDDQLARDIILSDKKVNKLRTSIINELMNNFIKKGGEPAVGAVTLILITRDLERIADHATAIAEDVIYLKRAKVVKHHKKELRRESKNTK